MKNDCANCPRKDSVFNAPPVPFVTHENMRAQMDSCKRRLIGVIILLIVLLVGSNALWLWHESEYEDVSIEQQNERGINNFIGNDGDIYNGETDYPNP